MIVNEYVSVNIERGNKKYYILNGIECKVGDTILIHYSILPKTSSVIIQVECDYCMNKYPLRYGDYTKALSGVINKIACKQCLGKKNKESNLINYGVENVSQLDSVKRKKIESNLINFGVENYLTTQECKDKIKATNINIYGCENPFQNKEIQNKQKETCIKEYGCENVFQNEKVKEKSNSTMISKYGVEKMMQHPEKKIEIMSKVVQTKFKHGTAPCSSQQAYIHSLIGGELNYPVNSFYLDIAFPNEKIYIEYDGSGHNLSIKLNHITATDFHKMTLDRYFILKRLGWKEIIIQSSKDFLPEDKIIINLINENKRLLLESEISHIVINIDKDNYGSLRKIKTSTENK